LPFFFLDLVMYTHNNEFCRVRLFSVTASIHGSRDACTVTVSDGHLALFKAVFDRHSATLKKVDLTGEQVIEFVV
jgi:hypothetical protein